MGVERFPYSSSGITAIFRQCALKDGGTAYSLSAARQAMDRDEPDGKVMANEPGKNFFKHKESLRTV